MSTFAFKALDLAGTSTRGEVEGDTKQGVAAQLRGKGLIVLDIEELKPASAGDLLANFKKVSADELTIATRQLATMVSSGMSLLRSLYVIEEQTENDKLREAFVQVRKDVEAGLRAVPGPAAPRRHLQRVVRGHGGRGRVGRHPGGHPSTRGRPAREGCGPAPHDQVGNGLPGRDLELRRDRAVGPGHLPRSGVRGRLQGLRR
ncbi:MAG: type II secretion system F family protein [Thermoleophilaceae bacterium]|nr:type II secretion system F family protein [Thermoleophilaceae bacterium]